jgi:2',3'-cyclic-nucleotide 2'-phosphodiesterase (5'-nucleotidase family)
MKEFFRKYAWLWICGLLLWSCKTPAPRVEKLNEQYIPINPSLPADSGFLKDILPYKTSLDNEMNAVLIKSDSAAVKDEPEGSLGNLVCDLLLEKAMQMCAAKQVEVDACLMNKGGLRAPLPKGDITLGKVYELMPFENELVLVTISPENTLQLCKYIARSGGQPVAGITMAIKDTSWTSLSIAGKPFDAKKNYSILTSDYLAFGGDKMRFFKNPVGVLYLNKKIRECLVEAMTEKNKQGLILKPRKDGRITFAK